MGLQYQIRFYSPGDSIPLSGILLIRHGPREASIDALDSTPLSEFGVAKVEEFAREWLSATPAVIISSPVGRCIRTAEIIRDLKGWELDVIRNRILGAHGPFVVNSKLVSNQLSELDSDGARELFMSHMSGESIPGMRSVEEGANLLLQELVSSLDEGLCLAITHDVIIAAFSTAFGLNPNRLPEPLEGVIIEERE